MGIRDFILRHLDEKDVDRFAAWAFGSGYEQFPCSEYFITAWNMMHCELMELTGYNDPAIDIPKMIGFWISQEEWERDEKRNSWNMSELRWRDK